MVESQSSWRTVRKTLTLRDSAISQIFRSSALPEIYNRWFGAMGPPGPVLEVMFALGRLPE